MRLIDANALLTKKFITDDIDSYDTIPVDEIVDAPTIDAVEVVRCRDCKHYQPEPMGSVLYCYQNRRWTEPDFYCADGEKMDAEVEG